VRWELAVEDPMRVHTLAASLRDLPELFAGPRALHSKKQGSHIRTLARLLIRRGITDADSASRFLFLTCMRLRR
jgi:hypothetical protein